MREFSFRDKKWRILKFFIMILLIFIFNGMANLAFREGEYVYMILFILLYIPFVERLCDAYIFDEQK